MPPSVPGASRLRRRTLANVPRTMTSSLPLHAHAVKIRRILHIRRGGVPSIEIALRHGEGIPAFIPLEDLAVDLLKHGRFDGALHGVQHFLLRGPKVPKVNGLTVRPVAERLVVQVDVHT